MDEFRQQVKDQVVAANRGPFGGWWEALLELDPELLRRIHVHLEVAESSGPIPERLRHLIWTAVDAVVTHLYPRGLGVHAAIALEKGASVKQVLEALSISASVSSRGYGFGLPLLLDEARRAGLEIQESGDEALKEYCRSILEQRLGSWPEWMEAERRVAPEGLAAFLDLAYGREEEDGLDLKSRELIFLATAACPAIIDEEMTRRHIRRALEVGATPDEVMQALRLANGIGLHPVSEGVMKLKEQVVEAS